MYLLCKIPYLVQNVAMKTTYLFIGYGFQSNILITFSRHKFHYPVGMYFRQWGCLIFNLYWRYLQLHPLFYWICLFLCMSCRYLLFGSKHIYMGRRLNVSAFLFLVWMSHSGWDFLRLGWCLLLFTNFS